MAGLNGNITNSAPNWVGLGLSKNISLIDLTTLTPNIFVAFTDPEPYDNQKDQYNDRNDH